ncbi:MAG: hypothetical protein NVSMB46_03760 [Candidatus Saccharimonadales bacterium]
MNNVEVSNENQELHSEHKTLQSYVIGFMLSLVLTFIPYILVVNKSASSRVLLLTILGFALLQMIVQVTFFLHLGRGPKPRWNLYFFAGTVGIIFIVVGGSIMIINNLHYNMQPLDQTKKIISDEGIYQVGGEKTGACQAIRTHVRIIVKNSKFVPLHTFANKCDSLTFVNDDSSSRTVIFGKYPFQTPYAGVNNLLIPTDRGKTVTLSEVGKYMFYDSSQTKSMGDVRIIP